MRKFVVEKHEANRGVTGQWEIWANDPRDAEEKAEQMYGTPDRDFAYSAKEIRNGN